MGRDEWRGDVERHVLGHFTEDGPYGHHAQGLLAAQRRQQGDETLGEHRLARPWRTREHQVVPSGGGDLECQPGGLLAHHVGQVPMLAWEHADRGHTPCREALQRKGAVGVDEVLERGERMDPDALNQARLCGVAEGNHDPFDARSGGSHDRRKDPGHLPDRSVQAELSEVHDALRLGTADHALRREQGARDREVEPAAPLRDRGGREVDRHAIGGDRMVGDEGGRSDPARRLCAGRVGETADGEGRQSGSDMCLDGDDRPAQTAKRDRERRAEPHHPTPVT